MKVLSIDGGGVRGIIAAYILAEFEKEIGKPCNEVFDVISGSSTGSILACALAAGFPARDIVSMYMKMAKRIFPSFFPRVTNRISRTFSQGFSAPKYDNKFLVEVLKEVFGDKTIGELPVTLVIPTYNLFDEEDFIIKNNKHPHKDIKIWEVCVASSAAPSVFSSWELDDTHILIDGGITANNPVLCAVAEAISQSGCSSKDVEVVSIGTGKYRDANSTLYKKSDKMGLLEWISSLIGIILDGSSESTKYIAKRILHKDKYFRLQAKISKDLSTIDKTSNMKKLLHQAKEYVKTKDFEASIKGFKKLIK